MPLLQSQLVRNLVNRRHRISIKSSINFIQFAEILQADYSVQVINTATGKPLQFAPIQILVDGLLFRRTSIDQNGKLVISMQFIKSGIHKIESIIASSKFTTIGSPSDVLSFSAYGVQAQSMNADTGEYIGTPITIQTSERTITGLGANVRNLIPLLGTDTSITVSYPEEIPELDLGLYDLEQDIKDRLEKDLLFIKKYMPFKRISVQSSICTANITGEPLSRLRADVGSRLKALKTTIISFLSDGPPIEKRLGTLFSNGWIINEVRLDLKKIEQRLVQDLTARPVCQALVSIHRVIPGLNGWRDNSQGAGSAAISGDAWVASTHNGGVPYGVAKLIDLSNIDMSHPYIVSFHAGCSLVCNGTAKIELIDDQGNILKSLSFNGAAQPSGMGYYGSTSVSKSIDISPFIQNLKSVTIFIALPGEFVGGTNGEVEIDSVVLDYWEWAGQDVSS